MPGFAGTGAEGARDDSELGRKFCFVANYQRCNDGLETRQGFCLMIHAVLPSSPYGYFVSPYEKY